MGNSSYTLAIQTEETNYSAGDLVNGRVYLSVNEPSIDCQALIIHFHGQEHATVHYDSTDRGDNSCDQYETHKETILDENTFLFTASENMDVDQYMSSSDRGDRAKKRHLDEEEEEGPTRAVAPPAFDLYRMRQQRRHDTATIWVLSRDFHITIVVFHRDCSI